MILQSYMFPGVRRKRKKGKREKSMKQQVEEEVTAIDDSPDKRAHTSCVTHRRVLPELVIASNMRRVVSRDQSAANGEHERAWEKQRHEAGETKHASKERFAKHDYPWISSQERGDDPNEETAEDKQRDDVDLATAQHADHGFEGWCNCRYAKRNQIRDVIGFQQRIADIGNGSIHNEQAQNSVEQREPARR